MTTTEAKHSGYAQSETQWKTQDEIHRDDRAFVLTVLNEQLNDYLLRLGYPVKKGEWCFEDGDGLSLKERLDIDIRIAERGVPIAMDYWYEKYMLPKPKPGEDVGEDSNDPEDPNEPDDDMPEDKPGTAKRTPGKP